SEGLISVLDVSVLYQYTAEQVPDIRKTIGTNPRDTVLVPYARDAIRSVASGYQVKALYSDVGRTEISKKILSILKERLESKNIHVTDVLLRDVKLPSTFTESIENKLKSEQEALQKEF